MTVNATLRDENLNSQLLFLNERMEVLAAAGEWQQVEELMARRNAALQSLDAADRESALVAARRTTRRVQRIAESARMEVAEKLRQLQRGRQATDSYLSHA